MNFDMTQKNINNNFGNENSSDQEFQDLNQICYQNLQISQSTSKTTIVDEQMQKEELKKNYEQAFQQKQILKQECCELKIQLGKVIAKDKLNQTLKEEFKKLATKNIALTELNSALSLANEKLKEDIEKKGKIIECLEEKIAGREQFETKVNHLNKQLECLKQSSDSQTTIRVPANDLNRLLKKVESIFSQYADGKVYNQLPHDTYFSDRIAMLIGIENLLQKKSLKIKNLKEKLDFMSEKPEKKNENWLTPIVRFCQIQDGIKKKGEERICNKK